MTTYVYYSANPSIGSIQQITEQPNGSWGNQTPITIDGQIPTNLADPDVTILSNGTYLLAYSTLIPGSGTPMPGVPIYTAESTDGINFTNAQPAFTIPKTEEVSDPSIVQLANGSFVMSAGNFANPSGGASFYISQNGQNYTPTGVTLTQSDISPDMVFLGNGDVRLYTLSGMGIVSFISNDKGMTWTQEAGVRLAATDAGLVSVIQAGPNLWDMVYQQPINPNGPGGPMNDELTLATSTDGLNFAVTQTGFLTSASSADVVVVPAVAPTPGLLGVLSVDEQTELIYIGYFDRAADGLGFAFWEGQDAHAQASVASGGFGQSAAVALTNIANSFTPQAETIALYPFLSNPNPNYSDPTVRAALTTFVENVYGDMFGHAADSGGLAYWTGQIESGAVGLGAAVLAIANGAQGTDATILQNKITVALDFTNQTAAAKVPVTPTLVAEAKVILAGVDGSSLNDASVAAAEFMIPLWISMHPNGASVAIVGSALPASHALMG
jgi:hypothetical protein